MKKIFLMIMMLLIAPLSYAGEGAALQDANGNAISASNPLPVHLIGGGGSTYTMITQSGSNIGINTVSPGYTLEVNGNVGVDGSIYAIGAGNVGINTTNPAYQLHVVGDINVDGNIYQNGTAFAAGSSQWATNGTHIYKNNAGNVGIGTTTPEKDFQVEGGFGLFSRSSAGGVYLRDSGAGTNLKLFGLFSGSGNLNFNTYTDAFTFTATRMTLTSAGNVGIGSATPAAKLDITGGNAIIRSTGALLFGDDALAGVLMSSATAGRMKFVTANTERMSISGGNVGINQISPAFSLDVTGSIRSSNSLEVDGYIYTNGTPGVNKTCTSNIVVEKGIIKSCT